MPIGANVNSERSQYKHETIFFPPSMLLLLDSVLNSDKNPTNTVKSQRSREVLLNDLSGDRSFSNQKCEAESEAEEELCVCALFEPNRNSLVKFVLHYVVKV